jgi:uncharacterized membrane protein (UPF0127 family)
MNVSRGQAKSTIALQSSPTANVVRLDVELALTREHQVLGLKGRASLPDGHGMLFVFPAESNLCFWMDGTQLPLDIVFIAGNGKVSKVAHGEPYSAVRHCGFGKYVLEVGAGWAARHGIGRGSSVVLWP